jgi:two-component system, NarL family, sensor histidine kinase DesK
VTDLGPVPANPWERWGWLMGAVWLAFLGFPIAAVLTSGEPAWAIAAGLAALVAFAAVYIHGLVRLSGDQDQRRVELEAWLHLVALALLIAVVCAVIGGDGLGALPFVVALAMLTLRIGWALAVAAVAVALPLVLPALGIGASGTQFYAIIVGGVAFVTGMVRVLERGDAAHRHMQREYEIVAERERVARDVHDVLGHSLTVLAAKAELAERVLDADPERTRDELRQIQSLTRESIAEIRATVAGLRVSRLGDELDGARTALAAAGIGAEVPDDTEIVDPRHRLVLAWVLREAVTNVVRHSGADRCVVTLGSHGLRVVDDGRGIGEASYGNGLRGIRERTSAVGGTLEVRPGPNGRGTTLEVSL